MTLKSEWADGTTRLLFEPVELLEKLAALTPRPRINLLLYHGVFAPHARWRRQAVARNREEALTATAPPAVAQNPESAAPAASAAPSPVDYADPPPEPRAPSGAAKLRHWTWANLMRRAFDLDVLACPSCGGRMTLIATIDDPCVIRRILGHLGLPAEVPHANACRPPPSLADFFTDTPA